VYGTGFRVCGVKFRFEGLGCVVSRFGIKVYGLGFRVHSTLRFRMHSFEFRV